LGCVFDSTKENERLIQHVGNVVQEGEH